jgi:hypothetical protein
MISPSLWYPFPARDKKLIFDREPEFAKRNPVFPKTVFVSVGSEEEAEMIAVAQHFLAQLCASKSNGYLKGLDLASEIIPGEFHASAAALSHVIGALYPPREIPRGTPRRAKWQGC